MGAYSYAGFWWRAAALLIDAIIIWTGAFVIDFVIGVVTAAQGMQGEAATAFANLVNTIGVWLYMALQESSAKQATVGKRCCRVFVTDLNGQRLSFGRATARHFSKIISSVVLLIGYMMAGWTRRKQALHDIIAGCLVWRRPEGATALVPAGDATA
jgi:uncharacterized RDD family membrane protein YckC